MIKIVFTSIFYPVFMGRYFLEALKRREDVELYTAGAYTGTWIPWGGGMNLPEKYVCTPDCPFPQNAINYHIPPELIVPPWTPDLWLNVDAGWHPSRKPNAKITARIQTDPHVLKQTYLASKWWDYDFCMQGAPHIMSDEIFLPYAYDSTIHYPMELEKETDVCMIGLQYAHREQLANRLKSLGMKVDFRLGVVFDEYREAYNKSRVALSWSSLQDCPARVYEAMGMNIPLVSNRVPDLERLFVEDEDYLGFSNIQEAEEKVRWALDNYDKAMEMSNRAHEKVKARHTYDHRIKFLLETVGLL